MHRRMGAAHVNLSSGEALTIRPAVPEDAPEVQVFLESLSSEARRLRYHSPVPIVRWWMVSSVTEVDHDRREALLAFLDGRLVGAAEWGLDPDRPDRAHIAVVVDDHVRRRGIARALIRHLGTTALGHGIHDFIATVMSSNTPVFRLIEAMAPERASRFDDGAVEVLIPLDSAATA